MMKQVFRPSIFLLASFIVTQTGAIFQCPADRGGGLCPSLNTCCPLGHGGSGCIPSDMGQDHATCCDGATGCAVGYQCSPDGRTCVAASNQANKDPLVQVMPRYKLCQLPIYDEGQFRLRGLNVGVGNQRLAYYSSHGDVENDSSNLSENSDSRRLPTCAIVVVHGSGRNADDYFCSMQALATSADAKEAPCWVIAPHFIGLHDKVDDENGDNEFLRWAEENPWRYGADSRRPPNGNQSNATISSFAAMDILITRLQQSPVEHITVVGHSAGGQFVQRWGLLTPLDFFWEQVHVVVANPSSYAYLTPERFNGEDWVVPTNNVANDENLCPHYNDWEWGLEVDDATTPPYVRDILSHRSIDDLMDRYSQRQVTYLAGGQDRCNVTGDRRDGWCYSHGLETTCMDNWQGEYRLERSRRYFESLRRFSGIHHHLYRTVDQVGHDHSLIFHSPQGRSSILREEKELKVAASVFEEVSS